MERNEQDIFFDLEHEMGRDLTQWRRDITASFERCCRIAIEMEELRADDALEPADTATQESIKRHTIDFLIADWIDHKDSPHPRDFISVTGETYWYADDEETGEPVPYRLPMGHKLEGTLMRFEIRPYITEAGLEKRVHRNASKVYQYTHPYGLHLILEHATVVNDAGNVLPIYPDTVYLPIHYERAALRVYPGS